MRQTERRRNCNNESVFDTGALSLSCFRPEEKRYDTKRNNTESSCVAAFDSASFDAPFVRLHKGKCNAQREQDRLACLHTDAIAQPDAITQSDADALGDPDEL